MLFLGGSKRLNCPQRSIPWGYAELNLWCIRPMKTLIRSEGKALSRKYPWVKDKAGNHNLHMGSFSAQVSPRGVWGLYLNVFAGKRNNLMEISGSYVNGDNHQYTVPEAKRRINTLLNKMRKSLELKPNA